MPFHAQLLVKMHSFFFFRLLHTSEFEDLQLPAFNVPFHSHASLSMHFFFFSNKAQDPDRGVGRGVGVVGVEVGVEEVVVTLTAAFEQLPSFNVPCQAHSLAATHSFFFISVPQASHE